MKSNRTKTCPQNVFRRGQKKVDGISPQFLARKCTTPPMLFFIYFLLAFVVSKLLDSSIGKQKYMEKKAKFFFLTVTSLCWLSMKCQLPTNSLGMFRRGRIKLPKANFCKKMSKEWICKHTPRYIEYSISFFGEKN